MKRGLIAILGLVAAASVLAVAVIVALPARTRTTASARPDATTTPDETSQPAVAGPQGPVTPPPSTANVARAMDLSNIRNCVTSLKLAAATDDRPLRDSMLQALRGYGATSAPVIREAMAAPDAAENPKVRAALEEALSYVGRSK